MIQRQGTRTTARPTPTHVRRSQFIAVLALGICSVIAVTGCAAGSDSVATGGGTFDFVSPGGQTDIFYDPPEARGQIGALSGPDLMAEDKVVSVADYAGQVVVINLWGQWCGPCRAEADDLERVYAATKDMVASPR